LKTDVANTSGKYYQYKKGILELPTPIFPKVKESWTCFSFARLWCWAVDRLHGVSWWLHRLLSVFVCVCV